jgi:predicted nuclease with TOPRIM domain
VDEDLKKLLEAMREETRRHFDVTIERIETRLAATHQENAAMRQENAKAHQETRRHFDVAVERIETRFDLLAETVQHVDEELQRTRVSLNEKIEQSAAETQAMIKFSHQELDRRVTSLEEGQRALAETVADLQTRLQRLESGTH